MRTCLLQRATTDRPPRAECLWRRWRHALGAAALGATALTLVSPGLLAAPASLGPLAPYVQPAEDSTWRGECFVFDNRVSVGHGLVEGPHNLCHGCRRPILPDDTKRPEYEHGVSCHHCINETSEADKMRFRERQKQIALARARGDAHLGAN